MPEHEDWVEDISQLCSLLDGVREQCELMMKERERAREADRAGWCVVLPDPTEERPDPLWSLMEAVNKARSAASLLFDRLCALPGHLLLSGLPLSREQFHLLSSRVPLFGDVYDDFVMFHYEDDERISYINVGGTLTKPVTFDPEIGVPPEKILWARLRPEQQTYFERWFPAVAARFKRDP